MEQPIPQQTSEVTGDERTWGTIVHLSALAMFVVPSFGNVLGPFVVWLIKRPDMPFVDDQGKEALNFQITMSIAFLGAIVLMFVLIGFLLLPALVLFDVIMVVVAAMRANEGELYRYPLCLRFIK